MDESLFFGSQWDGRSEKFLRGSFFDNAGSIVLKGRAAGMGFHLHSQNGAPQFRDLFLCSMLGKGRRQTDQECPDEVSAQHARGKEREQV